MATQNKLASPKNIFRKTMPSPDDNGVINMKMPVRDVISSQLILARAAVGDREAAQRAANKTRHPNPNGK